MARSMVAEKIPEYVALIQNSNDKPAACAAISALMMELLKDKKTENIHRQFVDLNREIKKAMPELRREIDGRKQWPSWLPTITEDLKRKRKERDEASKRAKLEQPLELKQDDDFNGAEYIIERAIWGLR